MTSEQVRANVEIIREALGVREWAASITPSTHGERVEREMPEAFAALADLAEALAETEKERDALAQAGRQWIAETGPGQHINTAKGRPMMRRALSALASGRDGGQ